ncbi:ABC-2 type transport system ATP-binding protein [Carnobacterium alterfunditum]|uniref:ABC-2 type transport system ATP-binding protein n=2 Tax=Carnobacterium alterfunditum TaxID=28230 RepID=A0A1N6ERR7_9LACT|nr:ABC-2 type transport system ATP-binding protein [Carnobacterium alterfunditum]
MIVEIKGVSKKFGDQEVLRDIHLSIPEHSVFGFIGANGAGKTTLMKCMVGLLPTSAGTITIANEPVIFGGTKSNEQVGYLPDVPEFYPFYNARGYLELCAVITGLPKKEWQSRIDELLDLVGLEDTSALIGSYSRGMKQRLGIAQALLNRPKLLICDEPTSALDPAGRSKILSILEEVKQETTVFFSTHILSDAEQICDSVAMLHEGTIIFQDQLQTLQQKFDDYFVYTFTVAASEAQERLIKLPFLMEVKDNQLFVRLQNDQEKLVMMREIVAQGLILQSLHPQSRQLEQLVLEVLS